MANNDIEDITFFTDPEGDIYPEEDWPFDTKKLKGFIWRGDERIMGKEEIFDEDDNTIELIRIRGIDQPIDIDAEEQERSQNGNSNNPIPKSNNKAVKTKRPVTKKAGSNQ